jgi:hypothetical protein
MSLVANTLEIECVVQALENYLDAKRTHDQARDRYEGYSWGYFGRDYVDRMESNAEDFGNRLNALIESRVLLELKKLGLNPVSA